MTHASLTKRISPKPRRYETLAAAAERMDFSVRTLRRRIADGQLPTYRSAPRLIRVDPAHVDGLMVRIPPWTFNLRCPLSCPLRCLLDPSSPQVPWLCTVAANDWLTLLMRGRQGDEPATGTSRPDRRRNLASSTRSPPELHLVSNVKTGVYRRPPTSYARPAGRVDLKPLKCADQRHTSIQKSLDWSSTCCFLTAVRGSDFVPEAYQGYPPGLQWFEMVPEPGNPYDAFAVALDLDGQLAGYIAAGLARSWQWKVLSLNASGSACYVPGRIDDMGAVVCLPPNSDALDSVVHLDERLAEIEALYRDLPDWARAEIESESFLEIRSSKVWREWTQRRHMVTAIHLPEDFADARENTLLTIFLIKKRCHLREIRQEERRRVAEERKARALAEAAARKAERERVKAEKRAAGVAALLETGGNLTAAARRSDIGEGVLRRIRNEEGMSPPGSTGAKSRVVTAQLALELFEKGQSRSVIAEHLGVGIPRVKELLSLARFLRDPRSDPQRYQLAARARLERWTKSSAPSGVRFRRAMTDARDLDDVEKWPG